MIIDHWGKVLRALARAARAAWWRISIPRRACDARTRFPALEHRRDLQRLERDQFERRSHDRRTARASRASSSCGPAASMTRASTHALSQVHVELGGLRRPVFPAFARGVLGARGRHRQGRQRQHRAGRRRARAGRREDRLRVFRRDRAAGARGSGARRARDRAARRRTASCRRWRSRPGRALYLPIDPIDDACRSSEKVALARARRSRDAHARSAREAGDGQRRGGARDRADRASATARSPPTCGRWCASTCSVIVEQNGRREQGYAGGGGRYGFAELLADDRALAARARGGAPGAGQSRSGARAGRHDDRRARAGLARHPAARGDRPRPRRRLQSQGHLGVRRHASASRSRARLSRSSTTARSRGRRGSLNIDDEGTPTQCTTLIENGVLQGLHAGQAQRAPDGHGADRQRPARIVRAPARCRA